MAFILPRSFLKTRMQRCFPLNWHLTHCLDLGVVSYNHNQKKHKVPTIFMIWEMKKEHRYLPPSNKNLIKDINKLGIFFVKEPNDANFSIRRVGSNAGKISICLNKNNNTHYFVKVYSPDLYLKVLELLKNKKWIVSTYTTGPKSLSKKEIAIYLLENLKA